MRRRVHNRVQRAVGAARLSHGGLLFLAVMVNAYRRREVPLPSQDIEKREWETVQNVLLDFTPYTCAGMEEPYVPRRRNLVPTLEEATRRALARFKTMSPEIAFQLDVLQCGTNDPGAFRQNVLPLNADAQDLGWGLYLLWSEFFPRRGWERLKLCKKCLEWFVDTTKNRKKELCSTSCRNRYWSRERRREAGHGKNRDRRPKKLTSAQQRKAQKEG
jgi:hypothetical protein